MVEAANRGIRRMKEIDEEVTRHDVATRTVEIPRPTVLLVDDQPAR
jgi:hypothetical protein